MGGELALLEAALLGRARPSGVLAVREALDVCGGGTWCSSCGRTLQGNSSEPATSSDGSLDRCVACAEHPRFDGFVRLGRYAPPLDRLVQRVKAKAWHDVAELLGVALAGVVQERLPRPDSGWCVVPMPASPLRRLQRGIDHAGVIARCMARRLEAPCRSCLRARLAPRQAALDRAGRLERAPRMAPRRFHTGVTGASVLLVDDVRTTGATLDEARELLLQMGSRAVFGAVVCVAE